jgi:nucleoid-associated protein YgaU
MQVCSMAAPARALAAAVALHLVCMVAPAASQPQNGAASARARAEELAEHASRRFGELLEGELAAQAEHPRPASLAGPWKEALGWIERSHRDFDGLLRRLAGGEVGLRAEAASGPGWFGRARERFETIMRRLTEGAMPPQPPHAAPPDPRGAGTSLARQAPPAPDAGTIASERPLAERRHAAPAPAASSAPGGDAGKTSSEHRPDVKLTAPAAEPQPPARAVPTPATAAPRQREASAVKADEAKQSARSGNGALPSEAKSAAAGPATTASPHADRGATGADIAAAPTEAKPAAERAHKKTFAKRRSHHAARAQPPAAASTKAAASPSHRHARRGVRHRHAKASHACERRGADVALPGWYVVKTGDTLWGISRHHYGNGRRYRRIAAANRRRLRGTDRIHPCERLYLPGVPRAERAAPHKGDSDIANRQGRPRGLKPEHATR